MKTGIAILLLIFLSAGMPAGAAGFPEYSTAGFHVLEDCGRDVFSMNGGWLFFKGDDPDAANVGYDDSGWENTALPHGIEILPEEASGCMNRQGPVWYRKHLRPGEELKGKRLLLYFEAVMGKCKVWVNGTQAAEHYGGYLPVTADVTGLLVPGKENVIAVRADNSDDPLVPPGKPQKDLDFTYFGGIYRDCWLVACNEVYITDPNEEDEVAGGGLFVSYDMVSEKSAMLRLRVHVRNESDRKFRGAVSYILRERDGRRACSTSVPVSIGSGEAAYAGTVLEVAAPHLWSPEHPYLYRLEVRVTDAGGEVRDGYMQRIGIRSVEFRGEDGFFLNGKKYPGKLIGANRHQDFALIGNALPNSLHWRDAVKLRKAGFKVVRNTHYPQDPAFMDACDSLGLFVIENPPGWQFWSDDPVFAARVRSDIRNIVRRDRNRPSVLMWEPVLNETRYPETFAQEAEKCVKEEYPYPFCHTVADSGSPGYGCFDVIYSHPTDAAGQGHAYFTREWGDNVDDWSAHNSSSRASLSWGEMPQLIQAAHYACPDYDFTCLEKLYGTPDSHVGGCLWHAFDHQRGYHPDPFYGGVMDGFRQPKYSWYMFMSQRPVSGEDSPGSGPVVHIAHAMTPFSPADVTVYSNCDEVRLTVFENGREYRWSRAGHPASMPSPPAVFADAFDFMDCKALSRAGRQNESYMLAEGWTDGRLVASHKVFPAGRAEKLVLWADDEGIGLTADGSDIVTVVAGVADSRGNIRRLDNTWIVFSVEGEGRIVGDASIQANPRQTVWGTAPVLVRSTTVPGEIIVKASVLFPGTERPAPAELRLMSHPSLYRNL